MINLNYLMDHILYQIFKIYDQFYETVTDKTLNHPCKFRAKNWVEINNDSRERIIPIVKINLKLQCYCQIYVITVMHIHFYITVAGVESTAAEEP